MVNAWSLLYDELYGDEMTEKNESYDDFENPLPNQNISIDKNKLPDIEVDEVYQYHYPTDDDGYPYSQNYLADNDDNASHHMINANSPYNDGWTQEFHQKELDKLNNEVQEKESMAHYFKYHEEEILKDIEEYVSSTYRGHYTGTTHEYRNVQTLDLMAARDVASGFCQANILKYGSRYGSKDGKNKKDLMKVIHYAMLLLHFDDHYGKPSMPSGNFEQMP